MRPELYHKTTLAGESEGVLKFVVNKALPIISKVAICTEFRKFGKTSTTLFILHEPKLVIIAKIEDKLDIIPSLSLYPKVTC